MDILNVENKIINYLLELGYEQIHYPLEKIDINIRKGIEKILVDNEIVILFSRKEFKFFYTHDQQNNEIKLMLNRGDFFSSAYNITTNNYTICGVIFENINETYRMFLKGVK